jgi:hypothetical protein
MEKNKDDFYAIVSAITRFIETADDDADTKNIGAKSPQISNNERK